MRGLLSIRDVDRRRIEELLDAAETLARGPYPQRSGIAALLFFEPSLRTRVGFAAAAARLGVQTVTVEAARHTSVMSEEESLADSIRSIEGWCDLLCIRHRDRRAPQIAAGLTSRPVINCGNGSDEHPTQALVDLFTLRRLFGRIDGLRIALVGDLNGMRATHSLALALACFDEVHVRCITPPGLELPPHYRPPDLHIEETHALDLDDVDAVYVAGLPALTSVGSLDPGVRDRYRIDASAVDALAPHAHLLCPLPRIDEIARAVDDSPQAAYFEQSRLGLSVRAALIEALLDETPER